MKPSSRTRSRRLSHRVSASKTPPSSRRRWIGIGIFVLLLGGLGWALISLHDTRLLLTETEALYTVAEARRKRSEARRLILLSEREREQNPGLSLLLALESTRLDHEPGAAGDLALLESLAACRESRTLVGHAGEVHSARFSPDGSEIVTASSDGSARVWETGSGKLARVLVGHKRAVLSAVYSPSGDRILTGSLDGKARVWDSLTGACLEALEHAGPVLAARFGPRGDRILTASADGTARLWNSSGSEAGVTLHEGDRPVLDAVFGPKGDRIAILTDDPSVLIFSLTEGGVDPIQTVALEPEERGFGSRISYSSDGQRLATPTRILEPERNKSLVAADGKEFVFGAFGPWGRRLVFGQSALSFDPELGYRPVPVSLDRPPKLIDAAELRPIRFLKGHRSGVVHTAFSPDGELFVTTSEDGTSRIWRGEDGTLYGRLRGHEGPVRFAEFSPDGRSLVTASADLTARVWSVDPTDFGPALEAVSEDLVDLRITSDGNSLVASFRDGSIRVVDRHNGTVRHEFSLEENPPLSARISLSADSRTLAYFGDRGREIHLVELESGRKLARFRNAPSGIVNVELHPDGFRVLGLGVEGKVAVWNLSAPEKANVLSLQLPDPEAQGGVNGFELHPSGDSILGATPQGAYRFSLQTGEVVQTYIELDSRQTHLHPDGKRVLISGNGWAAVLSEATGELLAEISGRFASARFSPDGSTILTTNSSTLAPRDEDELLPQSWTSLWDSDTGALRLRLPKDSESTLNAGTFTPDGESVLLARRQLELPWKTRVEVWPVDPVAAAEKKKPRTLHPRERERFQIGTEEDRQSQRRRWLRKHFPEVGE